MSIFRHIFSRRAEPEENAPLEPAEIIEIEPVEPPKLFAKLRKPPPNDIQHDFFIPVLADVPLRDSVNLMDIAPYRLSTKTKALKIRYEINGVKILIQGHPEYGLATVKDYDVPIHMISHLNAEAEKWRKGLADKPSKRYRPNAYDILKFCRRGDGGKQHKILVDAFDRLNNTNIKFYSDDEEYTTEGGGFRLIGEWTIVSKTKSGKVQDVEILIPDWIYDKVVRPENPPILALHDDYFLLDLPLDRSLYRLARKAAGMGKASYMMKTVHHRMGGTREFKKFAWDMRHHIEEGRRILDYDFKIVKGENGERLDMRYVPENQAKVLPLFHPLKPATYETAKKMLKRRGLREDVYAIESEWRTDSAAKNLPDPENRDAAFIGWVKKYAANRG